MTPDTSTPEGRKAVRELWMQGYSIESLKRHDPDAKWTYTGHPRWDWDTWDYRVLTPPQPENAGQKANKLVCHVCSKSLNECSCFPKENENVDLDELERLLNILNPGLHGESHVEQQIRNKTASLISELRRLREEREILTIDAVNDEALITNLRADIQKAEVERDQLRHDLTEAVKSLEASEQPFYVAMHLLNTTLNRNKKEGKECTSHHGTDNQPAAQESNPPVAAGWKPVSPTPEMQHAADKVFEAEFNKPKYRDLEVGEVIQEGDEWPTAEDAWLPVTYISAGIKVVPGARYRRPIKPTPLTPDERASVDVIKIPPIVNGIQWLPIGSTVVPPLNKLETLTSFRAEGMR